MGGGGPLLSVRLTRLTARASSLRAQTRGTAHQAELEKTLFALGNLRDWIAITGERALADTERATVESFIATEEARLDVIEQALPRRQDIE